MLALPIFTGSDGSAACGGYSDLSEWQRSANEEAAPSATKMPGTATGQSPGKLSSCRRNSPVELYECGIRCYFLVFSGLFPCIFYDMVTAAWCPRTEIVPHSHAEVKRAFCSVSWQTGGASLRSAERVEQQSGNQGAAEDSCPLYLLRIAESVYGFAVCALRVLFCCIVRGCPRNATLQLWCNP